MSKPNYIEASYSRLSNCLTFRCPENFPRDMLKVSHANFPPHYADLFEKFAAKFNLILRPSYSDFKEQRSNMNYDGKPLEVSNSFGGWLYQPLDRLYRANTNIMGVEPYWLPEPNDHSILCTFKGVESPKGLLSVVTPFSTYHCFVPALHILFISLKDDVPGLHAIQRSRVSVSR